MTIQFGHTLTGVHHPITHLQVEDAGGLKLGDPPIRPGDSGNKCLNCGNVNRRFGAPPPASVVRPAHPPSIRPTCCTITYQCHHLEALMRSHAESRATAHGPPTLLLKCGTDHQSPHERTVAALYAIPGKGAPFIRSGSVNIAGSLPKSRRDSSFGLIQSPPPPGAALHAPTTET